MTPADWRRATIVSVRPGCADIAAVTLQPREWLEHRAGQHCELRFPGEELSRKYSIVSSPHRRGILEFGIQRLPGGIFSPRLCDAAPGEEIEIRGPLGHAFVWKPEMGGPLALFGAGAGITPLLSIFEHYREVVPGGTVLFHMSVKNGSRLFRYERYREVLDTRFTETEERIGSESIARLLAPVMSADGPVVRICGPGAFINTVVDTVLDLGVPEKRVRAAAFV